MPALVKALSKKVSKDATPKPAKVVRTAATKRKQPSREEPEVETQSKEERKKKFKEKAQDDKQLVSESKAAKDRKESAAKEKVEVKEKDRRSYEKVEKKTKADKTKVSEAPKGNVKGPAKRKKAPTPSPEPSEASDDEVEEDEAENSAESIDESAEEDGDDKSSDEEEAPLHGFSSDSDSSDEDEDTIDAAPIDVGKLPTIAKDDATVKKRLEKAKKQPTEDRGVLYLGRIPHGFYEDQMKSYFSQFGDVTRLRLSRNKKTGRSKHYAFIEFKSAAVAQVVAETMNNYLLMGRLLQCKVIPKDKIHPELWIGANRKFRKVPMARIERLHQNKERTHEEKKNVERRLLKRQRQKKRKLEALGIDYDFEPVYSKKTKQNK